MSDTAKKCHHKFFKPEVKVAWADVSELGIRQLLVRIKIKCIECKESYLWKGPHGFSTASPMVSPDCTELRAPIDYPIDGTELEEPDDEGVKH